MLLYQAVECATAFAAVGGPQDLVPVDCVVGGRHVVGVCGWEMGSGCGKNRLYVSRVKPTLTSFVKLSLAKGRISRL